jgi:hypothetical protein
MERFDYIQVIGDSMFVIKLINKVFSPRVPMFFEICTEIWNMVKASGKLV